VVFRRVCGLDVHKQVIVACVRRMLETGQVEEEVREFRSMTRDLLRLADWLAAEKVSHVAMESTGVYWKPVYNVLESQFEVLLVNAQHVKKVPGRKTDVTDCEWIAQLLQCGLLRGSFVPEQPQRELRDLTRHRASLSEQKASVVNRIHKILEDANIKLASVATDVMGVSGRSMIEALMGGAKTSEAMAQLARGRMKKKIPDLEMALEGKVTDHHRFMLQRLLGQVDFLEQEIREVSARIEEVVSPSFQKAVARIDEVPGINRVTAEAILAEIGTDMRQFPTAKHLASWAAMCPGNHESAGKRKSGKTRHGNRWLRRSLAEAAWAAGRAKESYFSALYRRLASRRGKKRAIIAVGHAILTVVYEMLARDVAFKDLGADYFDRRDADRLTRYHVRRLEALGHAVTIAPKETAA